MPTSLSRPGGVPGSVCPALLPEVRAVLFGRLLYRAGSELWGGSQWSLSNGPKRGSPGGRAPDRSHLLSLLRPQMRDHWGSSLWTTTGCMFSNGR